MGKNNKKTAPEAAPAAAAAPNVQTPANNDPNKEAVLQHFVNNYTGMSPDATVTALERIAKYVHDDPKACEHLNITPETQKGLNELVLIGMTTLVITEVVAQKTAFGITMNKAHFEMVKQIAADMGTPFVGNYLPTQVSDDVVEVEISEETINPEKDAKEAIQEESSVAEQPVEIDPTKFQSEKDLEAALKYIMVSEKGAFLKFQRATALLKSYLLIKAGDNADEKKKINETSVGDLLNNVFAIVGRMPIVLTGFGKYLYRETSASMSPVFAFCKLRDASKSEKGVPSVSSPELVGITRNLIEYCANDGIATEESKIEGYKKDIAVLSSKDKKKNAKGIEDLTAKIEVCKTNIQHFKDVIDCTHNPSFDIADSFLEDYTNPESENYKTARKAFGFVIDSYYNRDDAKTVNQDQLKKDVQQILGVIINMFRNPSEQNTEYSETRLTIIGASAETPKN